MTVTRDDLIRIVNKKKHCAKWTSWIQMLDDSLITAALKADVLKRTRAKRGPPRSDGTISVCPSIAESVYESDGEYGESVFPNNFDMPIRQLMGGMTINEEVPDDVHDNNDEVAVENERLNHALLEAREETSQLRHELTNSESRASHTQDLLETAMQQLDANFETIKIMKDDMHDMQVTFANSARADRDIWNASEVTLRAEYDDKVAQMRAECDAKVAQVRAECDAKLQVEHDSMQNMRMEMENLMKEMRRDWDEAHMAVRSKDKEIQAIQQSMRGRDNAHNIDIKVFNKTMKFIRCYLMQDDMKAMYDPTCEIDRRSMEYLLHKGRVFDSATRAEMLQYCM